MAPGSLKRITIIVSTTTVTILLGSLVFSLRSATSSNVSINRRSTIAIHYQSAHIPFNEWLSQFTLCFAPFAAHILTGIPTTVILRKPSPPLCTRLSLFNPITIIYRYIAITSRRVRAKQWSATDVAGTNAAFWDGSKWDSSEAMMVRSREWITKVPARNRVSLLSASVIGPMIVCIQGVQAVYELGQQLVTKVALIQAVAGLFIPLGVGSLFRLPPALWLSDEFGYEFLSHAPVGFELITPGPKSQRKSQRHSQNQGYSSLPDYKDGTSIHETEVRSFTATSPETPTTHSLESHLHPRTYWPAILTRTLFLLAILGVMLAFSVGHLISSSPIKGPSFNASMVSIHFTYFLLVGALFILTAYYSIFDKTGDTLIPCINSKWYAGFTVFWYGCVVVALVFNCLEMRRTACGVYTTSPVSEGSDGRLCSMVDGSL